MKLIGEQLAMFKDQKYYIVEENGQRKRMSKETYRKRSKEESMRKIKILPP